MSFTIQQFPFQSGPKAPVLPRLVQAQVRRAQQGLAAAARGAGPRRRGGRREGRGRLCVRGRGGGEGVRC